LHGAKFNMAAFLGAVKKIPRGIEHHGDSNSTGAILYPLVNCHGMKLTAAVRDRLRQRRADGLSLRGLQKATGIERVTLRKFLEGGAVSSNTLDTLAEYLGLTICPVDEPKAAKGRKK
jgi:hypothetical protein